MANKKANTAPAKKAAKKAAKKKANTAPAKKAATIVQAWERGEAVSCEVDTSND